MKTESEHLREEAKKLLDRASAIEQFHKKINESITNASAKCGSHVEGVAVAWANDYAQNILHNKFRGMPEASGDNNYARESCDAFRCRFAEAIIQAVLGNEAAEHLWGLYTGTLD